jgi:hypothetical protein
MSEKDCNFKEPAADDAEIISIMPFLQKTSIDHDPIIPDIQSIEKKESLLNMLEMSTDDIAGSVLAYYIYDIPLFEISDLDSLDLLEELKNRALAHLDLYDQIKLNLSN